jgi:hypothetical protein
MNIEKLDISNMLVTPMTKFIHKMFLHSFSKEWYETFWTIDLHSTIIKPTYKNKRQIFEYYPYAKEVLQLLSNRQDITLIMYTSSFPDEIIYYMKCFKKDNIYFKHVNENPNISSKNGNFGYYEKKFYFNILFDDKAGFDPILEWEQIFKLLLEYEKYNINPDSNWTIKY